MGDTRSLVRGLAAVRTPLLMCACLIWTSCGDPPEDTVAPEETGRLEVTPRSLTATNIGQNLTLSVTVGGRPVSSSMVLRSEERWLDDRGVLDAAALASAQLVVRAPGRAVVSITAAGQTDSVTVSVVPAQITVLEARLPGGRTHLGDGDTIVLRGSRMNQLTAANLNVVGVPIGISRTDSANARLVVSTQSVTGCGGVATAFSIAFVGAQGSAITGLTRKRSGELALAVGQALRLTDAQASCILLPPAGSTRYLAAYVDTRLIAKSQTGPEFPFPVRVLATAADRSNASSSSPPLAGVSVSAPFESGGPRQGPAALPPEDFLDQLPDRVPSICPLANFRLPYCRTTPYSLGEQFLHYPSGTRPAAEARVVAIRGNLVASLFLPDSAMLPASAVAVVDSTLDLMRVRAVPLLQRIFDLSTPTRTSDESGQLFISFEQTSAAGGAGWWPDPTNGHGRWGNVVITPRMTSVESALFVIAHEVLHTYQFRWRFEHSSPWRTYVGGWGIEGGASLFGIEMTLEQMGIGFLSNSQVPFFRIPFGLPADIWEYAEGTSLMRDLVQRLVEAGVPYEDALREVIVGSIEGWYGINEEGLARGPGLTARMRQRLGSSWNPVDGMLDWIMSQSGDDLTSNPRYQNRTVRALPGAVALFEPMTTISNGTSSSFLTPPGSAGVFRIEDVRGGSYTFTATLQGPPSDALEWLILRVD